MSLDFSRFMEENSISQDQLDEALLKSPAPVAREKEEPYSLGPSAIHGTGVFTTTGISKDKTIGKFWVDGKWAEAGRFTNHSDNPTAYVCMQDRTMYVVGSRETDNLEEITVDYRKVQEALALADRYVVADNFCPEIESVIASVHAAGFSTWKPNKGEVGNSNYEGMGFWGHHALMLKALISELDSIVVPNSMFFRLTNEGMEQAYIHSDRETGNYTCIAYLSEHDTESGTAFFKHINTGLIEMPSFQDMKDMGIFEELKEDMVSRDPTKWEQIGYVAGKYNRALIFDAPLFHSRYPLEGIGKTEKDGRLIWASHFFQMNVHGQLL